ncbi:hypothetical protein BKA69DRAFT_1124427 [Paraphysoderma sedebokerense]|nr:hypothetical protein BKA69DRAFT_1124427 [Paraphysoderma sedebokerense]
MTTFRKHGFIKPPLFSYIGDIKGTPESFYDTFAGDGLSDIKAYHDCFQTTYYPLNRPNQCNVGFTIANFTQFASFPTEAQSLNESATNTSSYTLLIDDIRYESGMGAKAEEIIQGLEKAGEYLFTDEPPEQKKKKAHIKSLQFKFFPAKETAHPRFNHLAAQTVLLRMLMAPNFRTEFQVHENTHVFQWEPVIRVIIPGIVWSS